MNRKQFIISQGASCENWTWSWSFINEKEKIIIFGAWDTVTEGNTSLILSKEWEISPKGNKQPGYSQSREHIRLIEEEGFQLRTFPMKYSSRDQGNTSPAKIEDFIPELTVKYLKRVGENWYASDNMMPEALAEEIETPETFPEGAAKKVYVNTYERSPMARQKCIQHHGYACAVCNFNFKDFYGPIGENFIHVHHIVPQAGIRKEYMLDPIKDLIPLCANCHAIIHRTRPALTIEALKNDLLSKLNSTK